MCIRDRLKNSDFVSVHARLTSENKGMIGEHEISLMKPTAYFINTGRAGLVDQDALAKALGDKKIMGAALDVFYTEPLPADSPFMTCLLYTSYARGIEHGDYDTAGIEFL